MEGDLCLATLWLPVEAGLFAGGPDLLTANQSHSHLVLNAVHKEEQLD